MPLDKPFFESQIVAKQESKNLNLGRIDEINAQIAVMETEISDIMKIDKVIDIEINLIQVFLEAA